MPGIYCAPPCTVIKSVSVVLCSDLLYHRDTRWLVCGIHSEEEIRDNIYLGFIDRIQRSCFNDVKILFLDLQLEATFSNNL